MVLVPSLDGRAQAQKPKLQKPRLKIIRFEFSMKLYNGLVKFDKNGKIDDLAVVDESFSVWSFIFNPLWFLYHRMWHEFFGSILIFWIFNFVLKNFLSESSILLFSLMFMIALNSKSWLVEHLVKRNKYKFITMVFANNNAEAKINLVKYLIENNRDNNPQIFSDSIINPILKSST